MPASPMSINLHKTEDLGDSPMGRIVQWAITYGRYIMVGTELIVLLAFISRFSLDRKLTDLNEDISQKQAILEANQSLEADIRILQKRLDDTGKIMDREPHPVQLLQFFQSALPPGVYLSQLTITQETVTASVTAPTNEGFSQFLVMLNASPLFKNVEIGDILKDPLLGLQFRFTAGRVSQKGKNDK